jgi:hypothetical protein
LTITIFAGFAFVLIPIAHKVIGAKFRREEDLNEDSERGPEE